MQTFERSSPLSVGREPGPEDGRADRPAEPFDLDEFLRRVAEREGNDEEVALGRTTVVLHALRPSVPPKEFTLTVDQLPAEVAALLSARGRPAHAVRPGGELVQLVAGRSGLPAEDALTALAAVVDDRLLADLLRDLPDDFAVLVGAGGRAQMRGASS